MQQTQSAGFQWTACRPPIRGIPACRSAWPTLPQFLKHNPANPQWADRDRFVLSAGHGSMLIYSLLHLAGYDLPLEELKNFRQWGSKTAGHPEYGHTPGVETTTGPLGQGIGNAVGMALAEKMLAARFNSKDQKIVDHFTYVIASEGEFMEGISHEVFSLAGNHGLGDLIVFYDENFISIEGDTHITYTDDVEKRMEAYGWHVQRINGHDYDDITSATRVAQKETGRPSVIICNTTIGFGSPNKAGSHDCHGAPLGDDEVALTKKALGISPEKFHVPAEVYAGFAEAASENAKREAMWNESFAAFAKANPEKAAEWDICIKGELPECLSEKIEDFEAGGSIATRSASGKILQDLAKAVPYLVGGSADLAPSNNTGLKGLGDVGANAFEGRNLHYGVREIGMGAIMNGMQVHGGFRVFGATFLVFADYVRPTTRVAALMNLPVIYVYTHDSFYVGEDGPTHQPIETLMSLRITPNVTVIRPSDAIETKCAWVAALENKTGPTALLLTRQNLPIFDRTELAKASGLKKGAYTIWENAESGHDILIVASGSEVWLSIEAGKKLAEEGRKVRVVSFPCWELFEQQSVAYKASVFPPECRKRLAVEAGWPTGWEKYVGLDGKIIGIDHFGASAPGGVLAEKFGIHADNVYEQAKALLG
ncbi:Transketolase [Pontiella sulfatireligans]|uniref:Transketolase n=1 Tax=Pontiella sulfatireligans TaxID=2750658 RepID=A0A6C2URW5_9BACT|nr:transketolase [Pontiella sulfatireligans]VGO23045.1 Transketolase [Pontiella sulfatireligans]